LYGEKRTKRFLIKDRVFFIALFSFDIYINAFLIVSRNYSIYNTIFGGEEVRI